MSQVVKQFKNVFSEKPADTATSVSNDTTGVYFTSMNKTYAHTMTPILTGYILCELDNFVQFVKQLNL